MTSFMGQQNQAYFDPNYKPLSKRIDPPRVVIDNSACENATLIKVDSINNHGILLTIVQVLLELDLCISKAFISSDGGWFMDIFYVTNQKNTKITDEKTIEHIKQSLGVEGVRVQPAAKHMIIEITRMGKPGLLLEFSTTLMALGCNMKHVEVWTHNRHMACIVYITDGKSGGLVEDPKKQAQIGGALCNIMDGKDKRKGVRIEFSIGFTSIDRRLHQMMLADGDYEGGPKQPSDVDAKPRIIVENCKEKGYSIVNVESLDHPKLLFDTICTITNMQYAIFHAIIDSKFGTAYQEYYIRRLDDKLLDSEVEKTRLIKCIEASIERRVSDGLKLVLQTSDQVGLLSEMTHTFKENGLLVTRANMKTIDNKALIAFYLTDAAGKPADQKVIDLLCCQMEIGQTILTVEQIPRLSKSPINDLAAGTNGSTFARFMRSRGYAHI